ncbi:hypothetical protein AB4254_08015 [Vibrio breoganii]
MARDVALVIDAGYESNRSAQRMPFYVVDDIAVDFTEGVPHGDRMELPPTGAVKAGLFRSFFGSVVLASIAGDNCDEMAESVLSTLDVMKMEDCKAIVFVFPIGTLVQGENPLLSAFELHAGSLASKKARIASILDYATQAPVGGYQYLGQG